MYYFDSLCQVGPRNFKDEKSPWSAKEVLGWMDHCGIDGAMVTHTLSINNDSVDGRKRLAEDITIAPGRMFGVWTVLPGHAGDFEATGDELLASMEESDIRAVKLFPTSHSFPFSDVVIGDTLKTLQSKKILTMIDILEISNDRTVAFDLLDKFLGLYPDLPILLQRHYWDMQRFIIPLLEKYKNFHIEFSNFQCHEVIEDYVGRFGSDQFVLGTGLPAQSAGAARAFIDYSDISIEDKEKIAGKNLSRLVGGLVPDPAPKREADELCDQAAKGEPLSCTVIDGHCHVMQEGGNGSGRIVTKNGDADGILRIMDLTGTDQTALMSWSGPTSSDLEVSNRHVSQAVKKYPDRYFGVAYVNPLHCGQEAMMADVRKLVEEDGFKGIKPYFRLGLRYDDPVYDAVWEYTNERKLYALCHLRKDKSGWVDTIETLAEKYPDIQWLVAHVGGQWSLAREVVEAMKRQKNVWAEITYTAVLNNVLEWMVSEVGDDRIVYGTDSPMRDARPQLGWVVWADLPVDSRKKILGENFERLLGLSGS